MTSPFLSFVSKPSMLLMFVPFTRNDRNSCVSPFLLYMYSLKFLPYLSESRVTSSFMVILFCSCSWSTFLPVISRKEVKNLISTFIYTLLSIFRGGIYSILCYEFSVILG
jgi:hypothetical protein